MLVNLKTIVRFFLMNCQRCKTLPPSTSSRQSSENIPLPSITKCPKLRPNPIRVLLLVHCEHFLTHSLYSFFLFLFLKYFLPAIKVHLTYSFYLCFFFLLFLCFRSSSEWDWRDDFRLCRFSFFFESMCWESLVEDLSGATGFSCIGLGAQPSS